MFTLITSSETIVEHKFSKDKTILSTDFKDYLIDTNSSMQKYLNNTNNKTSMFDINSDGTTTPVNASKYYALNVNNLNKLFSKVSNVLDNLSYFFDNATNKIKYITDNVLNGLATYNKSIQWTKDDGSTFYTDISSIGYYMGAVGMLSNVFIPTTNVRNAKFEVLEVANDKGDLIRNEITGIFLLTQAAIDNANTSDGIKCNKNATNKGSINTYNKFLNSINLSYKNIITTRTSIPLEKYTKVGEYDENGNFKLTNFQNDISISELTTIHNAYLYGINYIRQNRDALFRDPRLDGAPVNIIYHDGISDDNESAHRYVESVNTYTNYTVKNYSVVFPSSSSEAIAAFKGWTRIKNGNEITNSAGSKIIIQTSSIEFWPVGIKLLTVTYNTNSYKFLKSGRTNETKNVFSIQYNKTHMVLPFGKSNESPDTHSLLYINDDTKTLVDNCNFFKNYNLAKNGTSTGYRIGNEFKVTKDTTLYPIYNFDTPLEISVGTNNYFGVRYSTKNVSNFTHTYYNSGGASSGDGWTSNDIGWPHIKINLKNGDYYGNLAKYIDKIKLGIGGYINEIAYSHAPDHEHGGYCKVYANFFNYNGSGTELSLMNWNDPTKSLTYNIEHPIFLWQYSSKDASKGIGHSIGTQTGDPIEDSAVEMIPKKSKWFQYNGTNYKWYGGSHISVQIVLDVNCPKTKSDKQEQYQIQTYYAGCIGYLDICSLSVRMDLPL